MPYPTTTAASDVWSLKDNYNAESGGDWPTLTQEVEYLVVAGGGGAGRVAGAGAGGFRTASAYNVPGEPL